jgi:hypothetical protein
MGVQLVPEPNEHGHSTGTTPALVQTAAAGPTHSEPIAESCNAPSIQSPYTSVATTIHWVQPDEPVVVEELSRAEYWDERKLQFPAVGIAYQDFDKSVLALSGGALGLSLTFIQHIAPRPQFTWILALAWAAFIVSLLSLLLSQYYSTGCLETDLENAGRRYAGLEPMTNKADKWTRRLNRYSIAGCVLGFMLLTAFAFCNLPTPNGTDTPPANTTMKSTTANKPSPPPAKPPTVQPGGGQKGRGAAPPPPPNKPSTTKGSNG